MIEKMRSNIDEAWPKHVQVFGPFLDQQTHASNQPRPIPPLGMLQVTIFVFPSEAELAKKECGF